jgi:hypothetical protein
MRSRAQAVGIDQFSIYDAPEPWGPWTTVFYTENWDVDPGESAHIPSKWISADGKTCHLVFAGSDSFAVRRFTLTSAHLQKSPDLTGDAFVDFRDFHRISQDWLQNTTETDIAPAPSGDGIVDWKDFAVLAEHWLKEIGLLAHWRLDETGGLVAHDSVGGYDGNLNGSPVWQPKDGRLDGAIKLNGMADYISTPFVLDPAAGRFSAFVWIRDGAPGQVVISQKEGANWLLTDPAEGKLMTALTGRSIGRIKEPPLISEFIITDGAWHRIGVVWNSSERILYGDDIEVARDAQPSLAGATGGLHIGADRNLEPVGFFSGLVDDIRIYSMSVVP